MPYLGNTGRIIITALLAAMVAACSNNTSISRSYVDPELKKLDYQGVLVVAVAQKASARKDFERAFADALSRHGVNAVPAYTVLDKAQPTAEEVIAAAQSQGMDTIMVTRYIGASSEEIYHPGTIYYGVAPAYGAGYYGGFPGYYGRAYEVAYEQPVWTTNTTHTLVSDLYITETKGHLWQAVSDTIQSGSTKKVRDNVISALVSDLGAQGLL
ncbi:hypothetical protein [Pseudohalioglobus lutimaris]|uniref:DUF4136 domain-containing protein n=1 Tax=Pseudohalioglobus lutimaris TaxID=1737061 RepID=A0A2N5X4C2_9GAMM|nr:hypothetical protein [Pseudohalioglobus lutimaris]PLW69331.1 hypothetical protein C0039_07295 [Pseudohalioglobus lutimaris]